MSEYPTGRSEAERMVAYAQAFSVGANESGYTYTAEDRQALGHVAAFATAHALLAVESRLAELVEIFKANTGGGA